VIFAVLDLRVAEVVLKRRFKLLSFFTIITLRTEICSGLKIKQDGVAWCNHSDVNLNLTVGRHRPTESL